MEPWSQWSQQKIPIYVHKMMWRCIKNGHCATVEIFHTRKNAWLHWLRIHIFIYKTVNYGVFHGAKSLLLGAKCILFGAKCILNEQQCSLVCMQSDRKNIYWQTVQIWVWRGAKTQPHSVRAVFFFWVFYRGEVVRGSQPTR